MIWWAVGAIAFYLLARGPVGGRATAAAAAATAQRQLARDGGWPDHVAPTLEVLEVLEHTFADSCLGVAEPDELCAQALTPGYLVQLRAMGRVFEYHVAGDRARYCPACSARLSAGAR